MDDSVGEPSDDVKNGVGEAREDVTDVRAVEYGLEGGQKDDVNCGSMVCW